MAIMISSGGGGGASGYDHAFAVQYVSIRQYLSAIHGNQTEAFYAINNFNYPVIIPKGVKDASQMFFELPNFNQPVIIPSSVTNTASMFDYGSTGISAFDQPIYIPGSVTNAHYMFRNMANFDSPITIGAGANYSDIIQMCGKFDSEITIMGDSKTPKTGVMVVSCSKFNAPIIIKSGVTDASSLVYGSPFNQNLQLPETVTNCYNMITYCTSFNKNIHIPNSVVNCSTMFMNCSSLNQNIKLPNSIEDGSDMFLSCGTFNQNVKLPEGIKNCKQMFKGTNMNQNVTIPDSVTDASYMFQSSKINVPIVIPNTGLNVYGIIAGGTPINQMLILAPGVTNISGLYYQAYNVVNNTSLNFDVPDGIVDCSYLYYGCTSSTLNKIINIPNSVKNMRGMLSALYNYNQVVTIPDSVEDASSLFESCRSFNQSITIPNTGVNCAHMFKACYNLRTKYIYLPANDNSNCYGMFNQAYNFSPTYINIPSTRTNYYGIYAGMNMNLFSSYPNTLPDGVVDVSYLYYDLHDQGNATRGFCISGSTLSYSLRPTVKYASHMFHNHRIDLKSLGAIHEVLDLYSIAPNLIDASYMFCNTNGGPSVESGNYFHINIGNPSSKITNIAYMFYNKPYQLMPFGAAVNGSPIYLPPKCENAAHAFDSTYSFSGGTVNHPIHNIPASMVNMSNMCKSLYYTMKSDFTTYINASEENLRDCSYAFSYISAYGDPKTYQNFNIKFTGGRTRPYNNLNCAGMFQSATGFANFTNGYYDVPNGTVDCSNMFNSIMNLRTINIRIPATVTNACDFISYQSNNALTIYFYPTDPNVNISNFFGHSIIPQTPYRRYYYVYCHNAKMFTKRKDLFNSQLSVTWSPTTNGYYTVINSNHTFFIYENIPEYETYQMNPSSPWYN